ncbi:MAG: aldehyde dehydrogenase family protein [Paracoccaceae bacterium]|nr:aldehyde dehydrogenase family protein [Paracoccaceae bacterium]MDE2912245.1 aldehyde dehydrogenase family protein [Paracoccaceae bacterium]
MTVRDDVMAVEAIMVRARQAQATYAASGSQGLYDRAALAAGWAIVEPDRNRTLAELAVATTGLGNVPDKISKNHRKTLGLLRDIRNVATHGVVRDDPETGITEITRPVGVVGAVVPSTNPAATPANNVINALKCGNAIVLSPSPRGVETCQRLLGFIHAEFDRIALDPDLVQMLPPPGSKAKTQRMLELSDMVVATGSQDNVRRAYSCGRPAIGVGIGNASVIIDETADLAAAARKIAQSKTFDNATSCSSENAVIVVDAVREAFLEALGREGGAQVRETPALMARLFPEGRINPAIVARSSERMLAELGLSGSLPPSTRFLAVETQGIGPEHPLSREKLSLVLSVYRAPDFAAAADTAHTILRHQGAGHSIGLHSADDARAIELGRRMPVCRVIVNQAHCLATGGAFDNGMPFSLSMGCGTWGGNTIDDNLHWRHFVQTTRVVRPIPAREPDLDEIFSEYWSVTGGDG